MNLCNPAVLTVLSGWKTGPFGWYKVNPGLCALAKALRSVGAKACSPVISTSPSEWVSSTSEGITIGSSGGVVDRACRLCLIRWRLEDPTMRLSSESDNSSITEFRRLIGE
ncbi:hypothetical protein OGAPHI_000951 [Ogataea philodendri]|uniref:Uncharacterized protein n=1 Tax=Ogataea philodendri TaxID=1378263 RepID=A0A9P8PEL0_9ASCO|nr:uncharacterized protein OGAPHI_000951 [Ogataea philodendri]KAH3670436.1 hypothetical protein OGAPHI_000951 [Ogataea philodendri]